MIVGLAYAGIIVISCMVEVAIITSYWIYMQHNDANENEGTPTGKAAPINYEDLKDATQSTEFLNDKYKFIVNKWSWLNDFFDSRSRKAMVQDPFAMFRYDSWKYRNLNPEEGAFLDMDGNVKNNIHKLNFSNTSLKYAA